MFHNLSLKKLSVFIFAGLLLVASFFLTGEYVLNSKITDINTAWLSFKSQHAEKARLENSLRSTLGYGGMIHDFKNYLLRKDFGNLSKLQESLGAAQSTVSQYRAFSDSQGERLALDDIQKMLSSYQNGLLVTMEEIKKGKTSKEIDELVRIDDYFALRGLDVLREEIRNEHAYYKANNNKPVLANLIRTELGYGGMIHSFKNYVLRGDEEYFLSTKKSIKEVEKFITSYKLLDHTLGEQTALYDVEKTLSEYGEKLNVVNKMIAEGASAEEIDEQVRISDVRALRALTTLDRDIIEQIDLKSKELSRQLINIKTFASITAGFVVFIIVFGAGFLYIFFSKQIITPVMKLSEIMSQLANGDLDVEYNYPSTPETELGEMARSLMVFKENERKRRVAEEEIRSLAMTDPLTGLANRNKLEILYVEMVALAKRSESLIAFFALDLDKFKPVNDELGHAAGDAVLKNVAKNLTLVSRDSDLAIRTGGDEFAIIFYDPKSIEVLENIANRIIALLSLPVSIDEGKVQIGVSIGIAIQEPDKPESLDILMKRADKALYEAKESGRNTFRFYNQEVATESTPFVQEEENQAGKFHAA